MRTRAAFVGAAVLAGMVLSVAARAEETTGEQDKLQTQDKVQDKVQEKAQDGVKEQDKLQTRDQLQTKDQLRDGEGDAAGDGTRDMLKTRDKLQIRDRTKEATEAAAQVRDQVRDRARDGSKIEDLPVVDLPALPKLPEEAKGPANAALDAAFERASLALRNAGEASKLGVKYGNEARRASDTMNEAHRGGGGGGGPRK